MESADTNRCLNPTALNAVPVPLIVTDDKGAVLFSNTCANELLGYAGGELERRHVGEILSMGEGSTTCRRKDGMEVTVQVTKGEIGPGGIEGSVLALGPPSSAEREEIKLLNDRVLLLLQSTGDGIIGINTEGRCTFVNRAALSLLGFAEEEFVGRPVHQLIHHSREDGSSYPEAECPMWKAIREGAGTRLSSEVLWCKEGSSFPADYSAHPIVEEGTIAGAVVVFRNVAEERALAKKMDYLATHDSLTGLVNRRTFELRLQRAVTTARGRHNEHVLCYLDLDQFKVVNDTCGHMAGDELLRQVAALLHAQVRERDTVGRLGGDEFGILIEGTPLATAMSRITAVQETIQGLRFAWEDKTFLLGASVGVVMITAETESPAAVLSAADTACYVAKESGRNRVHIHSPDDTELAHKKGEMQWVSRIHEALDMDRFVLRYQPIVPLSAAPEPGERYEILISMRERDGRLVPPGAFIPSAERFNVMPALDRWVVHATLTWLAEHPERLESLAWCSINLSGSTLGDDTFVDGVVRHLRLTGVPPEKICFEITETTAVANLTKAIALIRRLTALGCRFALDDFGSGMSSFAYLRSLPVDFLKIDGNFVREIVGDEVDRAMVEAIHQVGHVMKIRTIAEHLENKEILKVLREIGIDYGQGYRLG